MSKHRDDRAKPEGSGPARVPSRRRFWRDLAAEVLAVGEEFRGIAQQSLSDMSKLPDSVLEEMIPVWREGVLPEVRQDGIYLAGADQGVSCQYPFDLYEKEMVDQYACGRNLRTIADYVAEACGLEPEQAFEATKGLFIRLCGRGWCHPAASHVQQGGDES